MNDAQQAALDKEIRQAEGDVARQLKLLEWSKEQVMLNEQALFTAREYYEKITEGYGILTDKVLREKWAKQ